jgi:hypothetical protein
MNSKTSPLSPEYAGLLRSHLRGQSAEALIELILDLIQAVDEPTRQQFWARLVPPGVATADLRYPSSEVFLAELAEFAEAVSQGDYLDEQAQQYYGDDPADREYHFGAYDPEDHEGLQTLKSFLEEADSYFQAARYEVAADAYEQLIALTLEADAYETLGVDDPLSVLEQDKEQFVSRYFLALRASRPLAEFLERALARLARLDKPYTRHRENFLELAGGERSPELRARLEQWADQLAAQEAPPALSGLPYPLQLLLRLYQAQGETDRAAALWQRFRHRYPALYAPLLADREAAADWLAVIELGQEALTYVPPSAPPFRANSTVTQEWGTVNPLKVRPQLARAYTATGDLAQALAVYRPVFDLAPSFATYTEARRLAQALAPEQAQAFTADVIAALDAQPQHRYLLCQVCLSEGDFDAAYARVENLPAYPNLDETKLVAKAHLLAALGQTSTPKMGPYLRALYAEIAVEEKETARFLRAGWSPSKTLARETALARAEAIYQRLLQAHIDNGRKTYAVAAYYCALLSEIAVHEGRLTQFAKFYATLMGPYTRHRALRAEMEAKVGPLLGIHPK